MLLDLFQKRENDRDLVAVVFKLISQKVEEMFGVPYNYDFKEFVFLNLRQYLYQCDLDGQL